MKFSEFIKNVGRPVWLGLMAVGFLWFWPVGLFILALLAWNGMLGNQGGSVPWSASFWSSGNAAFDKHQQEARAALDKEREDFAAFIKEKLTAKDQAEFAEFTSKRKAGPWPVS